MMKLADGSKQSVLVPQVYVRVQPGNLAGTGALLAGRDVQLNLSAAQNINLANSTNRAGNNSFAQTGIDRVAGLYVYGSAGVLLALAMQKLDLP